MELSILERLLLPQILPNKASFIEMRIIKSIKDKLQFSVEEIECFDIKDVSDGVVWNRNLEQTNYVFKIDFQLSELEIIKKALSEIDKKGLVSLDLLPLYDKFN